MIKLYHGDCLEVMDRLIKKGVKVDAIITDPPYGTTACKWDSVIPFEAMWERIKQLRKEKSAIVLFGSEPFSSYLRMSNIKEYKYDWIWNKKQGGNPLNAKIMPLKTIELIHVFNLHDYYPQMRIGKMRIKGGCTKQADHTGKTIQGYKTKSDLYYPVQLLSDFSNAGNRGKAVHPTQKPVALMEYLIKTYTNEGDTVLDFTMGSGSTGVSCKNLKRNFIGIEKELKYFEIAKERIKNEI